MSTVLEVRRVPEQNGVDFLLSFFTRDTSHGYWFLATSPSLSFWSVRPHLQLVVVNIPLQPVESGGGPGALVGLGLDFLQAKIFWQYIVKITVK